MAEYNKTILTNLGLDLMRRANAGQAKFVITKVAGSSQNLSQKNQDEIKKLTSVNDVKQMGTIKNIEGSSLDPNTVAALKLTFDNRNLPQAYDLNTVAIYAKEEGKNEILYAVSTAKSAEHFPSFSNKVLFTFEVLLYLVIGQIDNVTVNVSPEKVEEELKKVKIDLEQKITDEQNRTYSKQEVDTKVAQAGKVKTVNYIEPDDSGNIAIDPPVSVVKNYNFDTGSASSEYLDLSKSHVLGLDVLRQIKAKLDSVKTELDKKINDSVTSQLDGKASKTDLDNVKNDLTNKVNSKASQSDFTTLSKSVVKSINNVHPDQRGNIAFTQYGGASVQYPITNDTYSKLFQELNVPAAGKIFIPDFNAILNIVQSIAVNSVSLDYAGDELDKTNTKVELNTKNITEINSAWGRYNHDSAVNLLSLWGQFGIHYVKNNGNTNTPSFISDKRGTVFVLTFDGNSQTMFFIGALGGFAYYNKLNNKWVQISTADDLKGVKDSLDQQIKATNEQVKAANTKIDSNTNRITALEKKETSHISANETDALNYSKAHPGIPVFVAE